LNKISEIGGEEQFITNQNIELRRSTDAPSEPCLFSAPPQNSFFSVFLTNSGLTCVTSSLSALSRKYFLFTHSLIVIDFLLQAVTSKNTK